MWNTKIGSALARQRFLHEKLHIEELTEGYALRSMYEITACCCFLQVAEKERELETVTNDMREMVSSLVPSHVSQSLAMGQPFTPETLEQSSVAVFKLSNFAKLSSTVSANVMVRFLNAINDVMDDAIKDRDIDKMASHPAGTFMLISGLRHNHARKHVVTLTLASLDICSKCRLLRKPFSHTNVINDFIQNYKTLQENKDNPQTAAELSENLIVPKLMCCIATGPVSVGVVGCRSVFASLGFIIIQIMGI